MNALRSRISLVSFLAAAVSAAGCATQQQPAPVAAEPVPQRPIAPAHPVARVSSSDMAWGEINEGWSATETVDNLMQISWGQDGSDFDPDLSPDGRMIVFASTQHRLTSDLYVKPVGGHAVTQLTNDPSHDLMPSFSPDGKRIAFSSNRNGSWDIFVVGVDGGQPVQLTTESSHELHPTWSPTGDRIAFCRLSPTSGRWELWEIDVMNTAVSRFLGYGLLPEWNPKHDKLAFQRSRERGDRLYSIWTIDYINGEPRNPTEIASNPEWAFINPSWSPDGENMVFSAVRNPVADIAGGVGPVPSSADLWMVRMDGSNRIRLTGGEYADLMPNWGPDGRVYFVSNRAGMENIWSLLPERSIQTASFEAMPASDAHAHAPQPHAAPADPHAHAHAPAPASNAHPAPMPAESHAAAPSPEADPHHDDHTPTVLPPVADAPTHDPHGHEPDPHH